MLLSLYVAQCSSQRYIKLMMWASMKNSLSPSPNLIQQTNNNSEKLKNCRLISDLMYARRMAWIFLHHSQVTNTKCKIIWSWCPVSSCNLKLLSANKYSNNQQFKKHAEIDSKDRVIIATITSLHKLSFYLSFACALLACVLALALQQLWRWWHRRFWWFACRCRWHGSGRLLADLDGIGFIFLDWARAPASSMNNEDMAASSLPPHMLCLMKFFVYSLYWDMLWNRHINKWEAAIYLTSKLRYLQIR